MMIDHLRAVLRRAFAAAMVITATLACGQGAIAADDVELSEDDAACQKCHEKPGLNRKLDNGDIQSLHISTHDFLASMHKETSCEDCHDDIDEDNHGKVKKPIRSKREYDRSYLGSCKVCHEKNQAKFDDSLHARMVRGGADDAPLCTDCHESHTLKSVKILTPVEAVPCKQCHEKVFDAYRHDVHGLLRAKKGDKAPICKDCHRTHDIQVAASDSGIRDSCLKCHEDANAKHKDWLPNAARHFETISCAVCHAPNAKRQVNLRLFDAKSNTRLASTETAGVPQFDLLTWVADEKGAGLDQRAVHGLLRDLTAEHPDKKLVLRGLLEVQDGIDSHTLAKKEDSIRDCKTCHAAGSEPFQRVTMTMIDASGRPMRHGVQKDVLSSLLATQSIRGFYAIGSTRIKLLDYALVMLVTGTLGGVGAHWLVRFAMRGYRQRRKAREAAMRNGSAAAEPAADRTRS